MVSHPRPLSICNESGPVVTTPTTWGPSTSGTNEPSMRAANARGSTPGGVEPKKRTSEVVEVSSATAGPP
jgi:hypothetical protein